MDEQWKQQYLIEETFPYEKVSRMGWNERYFHGRTPHSLHVWWARRPFSAMRAIIFSSLIPLNSPSELVKESKMLVEELAASIEPLPSDVLRAQSILAKVYERPPKILDIFGGGGTIALEGGRLGCIFKTVDVNPLACFVQDTILRHSQVPDILNLVKRWGKQLLQDLEKETGDLYRRNRKGQESLVFFWGHTIRCQICNAKISLSHLGWLCKKRERRIFLRRFPSAGNYYTELLVDPPPEVIKNSSWQTQKGVSCPFCGSHYSRQQLQKIAKLTLGDELLSICVKGNGRKDYILPSTLDDFFPSEEEIKKEIEIELQRIDYSLPTTNLPRWSGIINPPLYGINFHVDILNGRQLIILLKVIRYLRELYISLKTSGCSEEISLGTVAILSGFIDQLVDWNSRLTMWLASNEQVGRTLAGPGLPMQWSYVEINPFSRGPANLHDKLNRIIKGLSVIPKFPSLVETYKASAHNLPFEREFDAVITDPPYGDNMIYSALADCIYVWKRMAFRDILPELFETELTACADDIVASPDYHEPFSVQGMKFYEERLAKSFKEVARVLRSGGIFSIFFSHSTIDAWATVINAFKKAQYTLTAAWPLILERQARPRGINSHAMNVSAILIVRKGIKREICDWTQLSAQIKEKIHKQVKNIKFTNWGEVEVGIACFIAALQGIAQYDTIREDDKDLTTEECLKRIISQIKVISPSFSLQTRSG